MENELYPLKHLSVRVPWHDNGWCGTVCSNPRKNTACLKLKRIAEAKVDSVEEEVAGQSIENLTHQNWPCCIAERSTFMAPFEFVTPRTHPYVKSSKSTHGHMKETNLRFPAYSAAVVPFRWMLKQTSDELIKNYPLKLAEEREPELSFHTIWWQEKSNQEQLLNTFINHIKEESLVFFYAKQVPHIEDSRRVLIGVGKIQHIGELTEYEYAVNNGLKSTLWERMIQHSIRPDFKDGFLLPYNEIFNYYEEHPDFDFSDMIAFAPDDKLVEFSYASEHVSHDGAIDSLIALANALENIKKKFEGPWVQCLQWIDDRLSEAWKIRGPYPGLGSALTAFGISLGSFVAKSLEDQLEEGQDVWELVDRVFENPESLLSKNMAKQIGKTLQQTWNMLPEARKKLLKLISRFELSNEQAEFIYVQANRIKDGVLLSDDQILANPYLLYEETRLLINPISIFTIDKGVYPSEAILETYQYLKELSFVSPLDERRIRALLIKFLEQAADEGHTLYPRINIIQKMRECSITPTCEVHEDIMIGIDDFLSQAIDNIEMENGEIAYQLKRLAEMSQLIRNKVLQRLDEKAKRHIVEVNWRAKLDHTLGDYSNLPDFEIELEDKARTEKAAILKELAESRFSVLIGPAGTGKTTLLSILINQPEISNGEVLLLAPTGKARVRLEQVTGGSFIKSNTVAQFLGKTKRYDYNHFRYKLTNEPGVQCPKTVIVDEASMLTEEMMAALIESLKGVQRLIFVGDPQQLPSIGPGRPFVDIVTKLKPVGVDQIFPKVGKGYGQLTIPRRQKGQEERDDIRLAQWFSRSQSVSDDEFFDPSVNYENSKTLKFYQWENEEDLPTLLKDVLIKELGLESDSDEEGFEKSLGGILNGQYIYFNTWIFS